MVLRWRESLARNRTCRGLTDPCILSRVAALCPDRTAAPLPHKSPWYWCLRASSSSSSSLSSPIGPAERPVVVGVVAPDQADALGVFVQGDVPPVLFHQILVDIVVTDPSPVRLMLMLVLITLSTAMSMKTMPILLTMERVCILPRWRWRIGTSRQQQPHLFLVNESSHPNPRF